MAASLLVGCSNSTPDVVSATSEISPPSPVASTVEPPDVKSLPAFRNVAQERGINAAFFTDTVPERFFLPEIMGGGTCWFDFDRDGVLDVYLTNGAQFESTGLSLPANWLYRGQRDFFTLVEETIGAGDNGYGQGCAAGDFDSDGFPDLYVANFGPNTLHQNNGDGTFSPCDAGVEDNHWTSSVAWADLNQDGWLDLYVTNYLLMTLQDRKVCEYDGLPGYCGPGQYSAAPDSVFLSNGDGTFREAAADLGMTESTGKGLALVVADLNDDRLPEVYVGNDMTPNFLYEAQWNSDHTLLTYKEHAETSGVAQSGEGMNEASMGIACADFNGDALPDIYLTHYLNMQNTMYFNRGGLQFEDVSRRVGTASTGFPYLGFGTVPIDVNQDGLEDLFVTNGHVLGPRIQPNRMRPQLLLNDQGRKFVDVSASMGAYFQAEWLGRGAASADYDNDGDLDILVTHLDEPAALLESSAASSTGFIGFELSAQSRIPPCGAKITVKQGERSQSRSLQIGGSYLCSSDSRLLFVCSKGSPVDVRVEWPSGKSQEFRELSTGQYWRICEGRQPW